MDFLVKIIVATLSFLYLTLSGIINPVRNLGIVNIDFNDNDTDNIHYNTLLQVSRYS